MSETTVQHLIQYRSSEGWREFENHSHHPQILISRLLELRATHKSIELRAVRITTGTIEEVLE